MEEKQVETVGNDAEYADGTQVPLAAQTEVKENKIVAIGRSRALDNVRGFIIIMLALNSVYAKLMPVANPLAWLGHANINPFNSMPQYGIYLADFGAPIFMLSMAFAAVISYNKTVSAEGRGKANGKFMRRYLALIGVGCAYVLIYKFIEIYRRRRNIQGQSQCPYHIRLCGTHFHDFFPSEKILAAWCGRRAHNRVSMSAFHRQGNALHREHGVRRSNRFCRLGGIFPYLHLFRRNLFFPREKGVLYSGRGKRDCRSALCVGLFPDKGRRYSDRPRGAFLYA